VSQPVDPAIFFFFQATASAPENHQTPAHANSEKGISGKLDQLEGSGEVCKPKVSRNVYEPGVSQKMDYGPMRDFWLRYSLAKGLEKKNSQPMTSSSENIHCASHEGTRANVSGPHDKSGAHPSTEYTPPVQSVGDQVVQGSVVAGEVGAPPDAMGVVAHPFSGSRDIPAGKICVNPTF